MELQQQQSLLDALTDHMAVYHCKHRQFTKQQQQQTKKKQRPPQEVKKTKVLEWLKGLNPRQRQAAFTIVDRKWVALLLQMQQHLEAHGPCTFFVMPDFPSPNTTKNANATQSNGKSKDRAKRNDGSTRGETTDLPGLCFRRSKGLMGRLTSQLKAGQLLSANLMVFTTVDGNGTYVDCVTLSYELLDDVDKVMEVLDEVSYGKFLGEQCFLDGSSWPETSWLKGMGYYSLPAFVANRFDFSLWAAWASALGTKQLPRSVSKSSARTAYEAAVLGSRVCAKKQCFEDWWGKLSLEDRNRMLGFAVAKVSLVEASRTLADRCLNVESNYGTRFARLRRGLRFLGDLPECSLMDAEPGCTTLAAYHSSSESVLRTVRNILTKVMNEYTERDLLDTAGSNSCSAKPRKNKHKKKQKRGSSNAPPAPEQVCLEPTSVSEETAQSLEVVVPANRKKKSKRRKNASLSDAGPSSGALPSCRDHKSEADAAPTTSNANESTPVSTEEPRAQTCVQPAPTEMRLRCPKAPSTSYRPSSATRRQNGHVDNRLQRGLLPKPPVWSWDWPPIYPSASAPVSPFGYPIPAFGPVKLTAELEETLTNSDELHADSDGYRVSEGEEQVFDTEGYNQIFGGGVMYWDSADYTGMGYSRPGSHSSEDSSWARREADLTMVVDDIVGLSPPIPVPPYASGASTLTCNSPSSSACSLPLPFDPEAQNGAAAGAVEPDHSSAQPVLAPIIVRETKVLGEAPRVEFPRVQEARSPHMPRGRKDSVRWKRSPSPVLRCVPPAPPPPPPSPVAGVRKRRGFAVRSGSSSPRHWGVVGWPDCPEPRITLPPEGIVPWRTRCIPNAPPLHPLVLRERFVAFSPLALEQEHPDVAFPMQSSLLDQSKLQPGILTLHREIEAFCLQVAAENSLRKPFVNAAVKKVTHALQVLWPRSRTKIFGSLATGLALPNSDVDMVVCLPPVRNLEPIKEAGILEGRNGIKETCLQHAARYLAVQDWVKGDSLKTIENTMIPIIKLATKCFPEKPEDDCHLHKVKTTDDEQGGPWGTKQDRHIVRLDISFESPSHTGVFTADLVKELVAQFPAITPLALVLKQFLMDRGLDHSYTGGLSSYGLVLLITRFLQHQHHLGRPSQSQSLGSLLMDFLHFFGCTFDPRRMCISIRGGGMYIKRDDRLHGIDPLHIEDPLHPMNNVGRNCFRVLQCTKAFADAYSTLEKELSCYMDRTATSAAKNFTILHKMLPSISRHT